MSIENFNGDGKMYCEHCGFEVDENDKFCPKCGQKISTASGEYRQSQGKKRKTGLLLWILLPLFLLSIAAASVFLFFYFHRNDSADGVSGQNGLSSSEDQEIQNGTDDDMEITSKSSEIQEDYDTEKTQEIVVETEENNEDVSGEEMIITDQNAAEHILDFDVSASSVLKQSGYNYDPENLIDFDRSTCWSEGAAGNGVGESVTFTSTQESQLVRGIAIVPGYSKSLDLFTKNGAPRTLLLEYSGPDIQGDMQKLTIGDYIYDSGTLYLDFEQAVNINECKITILEVRDGSKYDDCCISEMFLYY